MLISGRQRLSVDNEGPKNVPVEVGRENWKILLYDFLLMFERKKKKKKDEFHGTDSFVVTR